jgi:hypothetical protein
LNLKYGKLKKAIVIIFNSEIRTILVMFKVKNALKHIGFLTIPLKPFLGNGKRLPVLSDFKPPLEVAAEGLVL